MNNVRNHIISELSKIDVENIVIIDWGSGGRKAERYIHHKNCEIITVDIRPERRATLVADMCKPLTIKEADLAFCLEVLEHCYNPDEVLANIYNNLKVGGKLLISVPFVYPVHGGKDYWRFTSLGIRTLLERYKFKIQRIDETKHDTLVGYFVEAIK